jgi:hypothetical protein
MGRYDASKDAFIAEDLLVKCPSKYQELQDSGAQSPHTP